MKGSRPPRRKLTLSLFFLVAFSLAILGQTQRPGSPRRSSSGRPGNPKVKLVLLIVVDQFRADYVSRFGDLFVDNGIKRLTREGGNWVNANYDHYPTFTGPGHATMMTGAWPSETGIIGNEWPDRDEGRFVNCISDSSVKQLGGLEGDSLASPRRLMVSTIGDEMRLASNDRSKVIGISIKDRSAILPTGRRANAAYWLSPRNGSMISSTYYFDRLPDWVLRFNALKPVDKYFAARWERLLGESEYLNRAGLDAAPWEVVPKALNDSNVFPHVVTGGAKGPGRELYAEIDTTPFADQILNDFAQQAIVNESLGADDDTDVLTVSFSATDYVGHRYGPYSHEAMDMILRVDRQVAALLDFVDQKVGLKNTLVALTADHGMAPAPDHLPMLKIGGPVVTSVDILRAVRAAIREKYSRTGESVDRTEDYILRFGNRDGFKDTSIFFNRSALRRDGIDFAEIERIAGQAALTVPGIARYFTRTQLERAAISPSDPIARRVLHGFYPSRSGDVVLVPEPFRQIADPSIHNHGTPYSYDTHVPLCLMGAGITPGRYFQAASPADIAPTISALIGVQSPSSATGRILIEAISLPKR